MDKNGNFSVEVKKQEVSKLNLFRKKKAQSSDNRLQAYHAIVDLLGLSTSSQNLIDNPQAYYNENCDFYDERGIASNADDDMLIWIGIVNEMLKSHKACEFDYKADHIDFIASMEEILPSDLSLPTEKLNEEDNIVTWTEIINSFWHDKSYALAGLDINSDSYVVFICPKTIFATLSAEAAKTGHRIVLAQKL